MRPKIIGSKLNSPLGSGLIGAGLGSGSARARDYFSRVLLRLGSVQRSARGWLSSGLDLGLDSAWLDLVQAR